MMRTLAVPVSISATALGIVAVSVFGLHDTAVLTSPPEARAESFTRLLASGRYELAWRALSRSERTRTDVQRLASSAGEVLSGVGIPVHVDATAERHDEARASAQVTVRGDREVALDIALVREQGLWVVDSLPLTRAAWRSANRTKPRKLGWSVLK